MNEAAPWRALEDDRSATTDRESATRNATTAAGAAARPTGAAARIGPTWIAAAFVAAALITATAIWLVASGGSGTIVVEGSGPGPGGSARADGVARRSPGHGAGDRIVVDVQGAVIRPGIAELPAGARVADAIAAAGGYSPRVAADRIAGALNLAALVKDGDQVVVPSRDDSSVTPPGTGAGGGSGGNAGPVDLNRATLAELDALPGIGPVTAAKIIAARDEHAFASVDDLRTRKILGAATFAKVKDMVVVR